MTSQPQWSPVDDETTSLLTLVADVDHPSVDYEWDAYRLALVAVADQSRTVDPNRLRDVVRGQVAPRRIGAFTQRALKLGVIEYTGEYVISTDSEGRNSGRPCRVIRLKSSGLTVGSGTTRTST